jgi:hypothetical protein
MKIKILSSAITDLKDGFEFYEKQAEGIGHYFMDSLFSDIDSLIINAGIHSVYFGEYHRMLSKRFPFAVYYKIIDDQAVVYAVLDCRRSPAWTRKKLK